MTDFASPESRLALLEAVGIAEYNRQMREHHKATTFSSENGYPLRYIDTRWGRLVAVVGTDMAFPNVTAARNHAQSLPAGVQS